MIRKSLVFLVRVIVVFCESIRRIWNQYGQLSWIVHFSIFVYQYCFQISDMAKIRFIIFFYLSKNKCDYTSETLRATINLIPELKPVHRNQLIVQRFLHGAIREKVNLLHRGYRRSCNNACKYPAIHYQKNAYILVPARFYYAMLLLLIKEKEDLSKTKIWVLINLSKQRVNLSKTKNQVLIISSFQVLFVVKLFKITQSQLACRHIHHCRNLAT